MKRSSRRSWLLYGACAAVLLLALGWITAMVLRLETAELVARAGARRQESLRLALWRMDSWLAPHLAREVARPYFDYQAFYPRQRAYTRLLAPIRPGEVLTPSPLLTHRSDLFPLHFQLGPDGVLTSPQSPEGNLRDLAEAGYLTAEQIKVCAARLAQVDALMTKRQLLESCSVVEAIPAAVPLDPTAAVATEAGPSRLKVEWQKRQQLYLENVEAVDQQLDLRAAGDSVPEVTVGTLVPIWLLANDGSDRALIFARKVTVGVEEYFQGFTCNWPVLRAALLRQVNDLFEDAQLKPIDEPVTPSLREATLATLPATLDAGMSTDRVAAGWTPFRTALGLTWLAVLAGLAAVAVTLRSSIHYGEKRSRFASAVTHELRTPLTTFRMYTEMLAEGMVDASKQSEYLITLRNESGRLSTLVENVLCYAQLEEGRRPRRLEPVGLGVLLGRVLPSLRRRAEDAGLCLELHVAGADSTSVNTDVDVVEQILLNLVDNACKYASDSTNRSIGIDVHTLDRSLRLDVRDHGPGIDGRSAKSIFAPFQRGPGDRVEHTPGIGLGLALARGLARQLHGDLELVNPGTPGACFRLTLPL